MTVAALYVRRDSPYKTIPDVECFDIDRDARSYAGPWPVVAHPPCRAWGRLRHMAKPRSDERQLAYHALHSVRRWGGVLEHPEASQLWPEAGLLAPDTYDVFGGFTLVVDQSAFGHRARKRTWLYCCGVQPLPLPPARPATTTVELLGRAEREKTPPELAFWLVQTAATARKIL